MLLAMGIAAVLCIAIGVFPEQLYRLLPFATDYSAYDTTHVLAQTQLLFFSALAFAWLNLRGLYPPELPSVNLDAEWTYRRLAPTLLTRIGGWGSQHYSRVSAGFRTQAARGSELFDRHLGPGGLLARTVSTGGAVIWVIILLAVYLLLFLLAG